MDPNHIDRETNYLKFSATLISQGLSDGLTACTLSLSLYRLLQEQMEQSLSDTQHRLSVKMNELHAAHGQIKKLEGRIGEHLLK